MVYPFFGVKTNLHFVVLLDPRSKHRVHGKKRVIGAIVPMYVDSSIIWLFVRTRNRWRHHQTNLTCLIATGYKSDYSQLILLKITDKPYIFDLTWALCPFQFPPISTSLHSLSANSSFEWIPFSIYDLISSGHHSNFVIPSCIFLNNGGYCFNFFPRSHSIIIRKKNLSPISISISLLSFKFRFD